MLKIWILYRLKEVSSRVSRGQHPPIYTCSITDLSQLCISFCNQHTHFPCCRYLSSSCCAIDCLSGVCSHFIMFDISSFRRKRSLLALLSHLALLHTVAASPAEPSVTLSAGVVVGTSVAGTVHRFLGVPYADPPERFAPPRPASPWSTPRQAQTLPPSCMQQFKCTSDLTNT